MSAPTITTERLTLTPMCSEFLASTHEYASDRETCKYMLFLPNDSLAETLGYIRDAEAEAAKEMPSYYEMAVLLGDCHIGAVSLYIDDDRTSAELGWTFSRRYHGHGYATEAARALMRFAADELGIRTFRAHCDAENAASRRVMEKLGMRLADEYGGRRNKLSQEERRECLYVLVM